MLYWIGLQLCTYLLQGGCTMRLEGTRINRYRLVRLLGAGGMSDVYLAEDVRIEQQVAIKVMRSEPATYLHADASDAGRLFLREVKA
ncbi:MAG: hypothetical protein M3Z08_23845, partial [Chloroflexota bacterium]|nr:hypothetical protein [Chloroflexota bacterium]